MLIMRTRFITMRFQFWVVGRVFDCNWLYFFRCFPIADIQLLAWRLRPVPLIRRAAGGVAAPPRGKPVPVPPNPWGGGKTGGVFQGWVGYILQPFKTTSSKQGVQEKKGGMIFEQVRKK